MKIRTTAQKNGRVLLVLLGLLLSSGNVFADFGFDRGFGSGAIGGAGSTSGSSSGSGSGGSSGCAPTMTKADGTKASVLDAKGNAVSGNMPEGTVVYDFGSKAMVFCNGTSMANVAGSGGCRMCLSCGGTWPVDGGMPTVWDADWSSALTLGDQCAGSLTTDGRGSSRPPHMCCGS